MINSKQVHEAIRQHDQCGFCVLCGASFGMDPDDSGHICPVCNKPTVHGVNVLAAMLSDDDSELSGE